MIEIHLSFLQAGQFADQTYFSKTGEALIKKGTVLTPSVINSLKQNGIENIYFEASSDDELLNNLFSSETHDTETIPIDSSVSINELLSKLQPGKDGFIQLMKGSLNADLDSIISNGIVHDKPSGPAFKQNASTMKTGERTGNYKISVISDYEDSLLRTKTILDRLASGQQVSNESVRNIVTKFVKLFHTDRDILLNISSKKSTDTDYIYSHSLNVCLLAINIAAAYGYNENQITEIAMGALLHDAGMLLIPKAIRYNPNRPTNDEWYEIQKHPMLGLYLLERIPHLPKAVSLVAYQCHERENGKGYPKQRSSRLIHNYAKIVAVADIFEALSSPRSYREANLPYKAIETVIKMTRQGLISGEFVKAFLEYTSLFPIGSIVELSNNCLGKVVQSNGMSFAKPKVCILTDSKGNLLSQEKQFIEDLAANTNLQITKAHQSSLLSKDILLGF